MERTDFEQWKAKEVARLLALVETERRYYQEMVASLPVALVVLSTDRSVASANRAFRHTFGLRTEDLRRMNIEQILPSERLLEKIRDAHTQATLHTDFRMKLGGKSLRIAILPIRNWDDEAELETLLMIEDLTAIAELAVISEPTPVAAVEPQVIELAPAETPKPRPVLTGEMPAVVWEADATALEFTFVSSGAEQLLGFPAAHWRETPGFFAERIHPEDRIATLAFYEAAIVRGGDASAEYRAVSADGTEVWCRETIRVIITVDAKTITGVITDIGRRKQLEEQLLTAERSNALQMLASRLAHDLNNPLMIVTGYGEEILYGLGAEDPLRGDVQQILAATERIAGLTGQLLDFTHRKAKAPQPLNVTSLLAGLEEKIAAVVGEKVALEMPPADAPVWGLADPLQLEEIILTLISSDREDAQERSRLMIACEVDTIAELIPAATLKPGAYARITIHDDGRGLEAEKRVAVFESILEGKHAQESIGHGLARAYAIVREWGGDIAFFSEPFRGSTFAIYLTHCETPAPPPVEEVPVPEAMPEPVAVEETRETILVVDDEAGIRALVRKILRRERYHVLDAGSAEEALNVAASHGGRIDLLLTDVMLPGIHGRELAERMTEATPDLRVVYVSGYTADDTVRTGTYPPGSKFLQKPFTLGALIGTVRDALDA